MIITRWALSLALAAGLLAGCEPGYPDAPAGSSYTSETFFRYLQGVVVSGRSEVQHMRLVDACTLQIDWTDGAKREYDLRRLRAAIPHEDDGERYALLVRRGGGGPERLLVATSHWGQWVLARSSFSHLRGLCALSRRGEAPELSAG